MLSIEIVFEIRRLLDQTNLSRRAIARQLGVSRGVVNDIASGRRALVGAKPRRDAWESGPLGLPVRCRGCGGKVYLPCQLCRVRRHFRRQRPARAGQGPKNV